MNAIQKHTLALLGCICIAGGLGGLITPVFIASDGPVLVNHHILLFPYVGALLFYLGCRFFEG